MRDLAQQVTIKRCFEHCSGAENDETAGKEAAAEGDVSRPSFGVRFLGSMGVNVDRGE